MYGLWIPDWNQGSIWGQAHFESTLGVKEDIIEFLDSIHAWISLMLSTYIVSCLFGIWLMPSWYFAHAYLIFCSCPFGIWLMPTWYLAHAYLVFGSCLFGIWLMPIWYLAHAYLVFGSCLFERTSEGIWWKLARAKYNWIILNLRTSENRTTEISRSQGPSVFIHKKNMALCTWGQLWESMGCIILCCKVKK